MRADHFSEADCVTLEGLIKSWFENHLLKLHPAKDVTPYIGVLRHHIVEFLRMYKNLNYYYQQGLEN